MNTHGNRRGTGPADRFSALLNAEIRAEIARRRFSLRQVEELSGVSKARLSEVVNNDKAPLNTNELGRICEALRVQASEILRRSESKLASELASARPRPAVLAAQQTQAEHQRPRGHYNRDGEWVPATRDGYTLAAYETDEEKGVDYIDD